MLVLWKNQKMQRSRGAISGWQAGILFAAAAQWGCTDRPISLTTNGAVAALSVSDTEFSFGEPAGVSASGKQLEPTMAWEPADEEGDSLEPYYLVLWEDRRASPFVGAIFGTRVRVGDHPTGDGQQLFPQESTGFAVAQDGNNRHPRVVRVGAHRFLAVWEHDDGAASTIQAALVTTPEGDQITVSPIAEIELEETSVFEPAVAYDELSSTALIVFTAGEDEATLVYGTLVTEADTLQEGLGVEFAITTDAHGQSTEQRAPDVTVAHGSFGTRFVVVVEDGTTSVNHDLVVHEIDPANLDLIVERGFRVRAQNASHRPRIAALNDIAMVTWEDRLDPEPIPIAHYGWYSVGTTATPSLQPLAVAEGVTRDARPTVARCGVRFAAVWRRDTPQTGYKIYAQAISAGGNKLFSEAEELSKSNSEETTSPLDAPAIACDATDLLAAWQAESALADSDVVGRQLALATTDLVPNSGPETLSNEANRQSNPSAVFVGGRYAVAWQSEVRSLVVRASVLTLQDAVSESENLPAFDVAVEDGVASDNPAVARFAGSDGEQILVAFRRGPAVESAVCESSSIELHAYDPDDPDNPTVIKPDPRHSDDATICYGPPDLAAADEGAAVVWHRVKTPADGTPEQRSIMVAQLGYDGAGIELAEPQELYGDSRAVAPRIAFDGERYWVVWIGSAQSDSEVLALPFDGATPSTEDLIVVAPGEATVKRTDPGLAFVDGHGLIVWREQHDDSSSDGESAAPFVVRAWRLEPGASEAGATEAGEPFDVGIGADSIAPAVADGGYGNFLVTWADSRGGEEPHLFGAFVRALDGKVLDEGGFVIASDPRSHGISSAAADADGGVGVFFEREFEPDDEFSTGRVRARRVLVGAPAGTPCTASLDCASRACEPAEIAAEDEPLVCCVREAGQCEQCDSDGNVAPVLNAPDDSCFGTQACSKDGVCLLAVGQTCAEAEDCASGYCVDGTCRECRSSVDCGDEQCVDHQCVAPAFDELDAGCFCHAAPRNRGSRWWLLALGAGALTARRCRRRAACGAA